MVAAIAIDGDDDNDNDIVKSDKRIVRTHTQNRWQPIRVDLKLQGNLASAEHRLQHLAQNRREDKVNVSTGFWFGQHNKYENGWLWPRFCGQWATLAKRQMVCSLFHTLDCASFTDCAKTEHIKELKQFANIIEIEFVWGEKIESAHKFNSCHHRQMKAHRQWLEKSQTWFIHFHFSSSTRLFALCFQFYRNLNEWGARASGKFAGPTKFFFRVCRRCFWNGETENVWGFSSLCVCVSVRVCVCVFVLASLMNVRLWKWDKPKRYITRLKVHGKRYWQLMLPVECM